MESLGHFSTIYRLLRSWFVHKFTAIFYLRIYQHDPQCLKACQPCLSNIVILSLQFSAQMLTTYKQKGNWILLSELAASYFGGQIQGLIIYFLLYVEIVLSEMSTIKLHADMLKGLCESILGLPSSSRMHNSNGQ